MPTLESLNKDSENRRKTLELMAASLAKKPDATKPTKESQFVSDAEASGGGEYNQNSYSSAPKVMSYNLKRNIAAAGLDPDTEDGKKLHDYAMEAWRKQLPVTAVIAADDSKRVKAYKDKNALNFANQKENDAKEYLAVEEKRRSQGIIPRDDKGNEIPIKPYEFVDKEMANTPGYDKSGNRVQMDKGEAPVSYSNLLERLRSGGGLNIENPRETMKEMISGNVALDTMTANAPFTTAEARANAAPLLALKSSVGKTAASDKPRAGAPIRTVTKQALESSNSINQTTESMKALEDYNTLEKMLKSGADIRNNPAFIRLKASQLEAIKRAVRDEKPETVENSIRNEMASRELLKSQDPIAYESYKQALESYVRQ